MLARAAASGARARVTPAWRRWGPTALLGLAAPLVLADIVRHVTQDVGLWPGCGNNPTFSRVNSTDAFPRSCYWSSSQYRCEAVCCVPTWLALPLPFNRSSNATVEYAWFPPQSSFFPEGGADGPGGQFATLRPDGSLYLPNGFDRSVSRQPLRAFSAPLALCPKGTRLESATHDPGCTHGTNFETGACLLIDPSLPYSEQLAKLPLRDSRMPFESVSNRHECACDACTEHEDMAHLSPLGWVFTVFMTYTGFACLAASVLWNANISAQLRKVGAEWVALRARAARGGERA
mmetsp:Transcript_16472/g.42003  ORF Transcript_16472/g.42003 Transcript_16472/m.42003 type:complete len:291 (+) Transcript_16472:470-1342(+)